MAELDCMVENCVYNKRQCCCKGEILVGGRHACECEETCCDSFSQKRSDNAMVSALEHPCRTINIDCEAGNCKYNVNYKCTADHVDINGNGAAENRDTLCATFTDR